MCLLKIKITVDLRFLGISVDNWWSLCGSTQEGPTENFADVIASFVHMKELLNSTSLCTLKMLGHILKISYNIFKTLKMLIEIW